MKLTITFPEPKLIRVPVRIYKHPKALAIERGELLPALPLPSNRDFRPWLEEPPHRNRKYLHCPAPEDKTA
jgi:hypothetical protein